MRLIRYVIGFVGILALWGCSKATPESTFFGAYPNNADANRIGSVTSGGGVVTGSTYKLSAQIGGEVETKTISGSKYRIVVRRED